VEGLVDLEGAPLNRLWSVRSGTSKASAAFVQLEYQSPCMASIASEMRCSTVLYGSAMLWLSCKLMKVGGLI